ncbi:hypothetical protein [Arthrobacter sp. UCD-GKA]|uniref:hypothetical protein n=1 Tax=Arthrobacter sp. UCD-GKA TaxID=1913576 RepID=UPI0011142159|nr:hypothetical protein [Arthrobacter sp. UCD-GKA]
MGNDQDAGPELVSFLGGPCEADHLVMTRGEQNNHCDRDKTGTLFREDEANHDRATIQAQEEAAKKAAQETAVSGANATKAPQEKTAAETKAKKAADRKAAAELLLGDALEASTSCQKGDAVRETRTDTISVGDPGYSRDLGSEGDGVGCEWGTSHSYGRFSGMSLALLPLTQTL